MINHDLHISTVTTVTNIRRSEMISGLINRVNLDGKIIIHDLRDIFDTWNVSRYVWNIHEIYGNCL